jgi:hypothetical protein
MVAVPPFHSAMLLRQVLMTTPIYEAVAAYTPVEGSSITLATDYAVRELQEVLGAVFAIGDFEITPLISLAYLAATGIIIFAIATHRMRKL